MLKRISLGLAATVCVASMAMAQDDNTDEREAAVRAAVSAFGEAFAAADVGVLGDMLTANYLHVNGSSGNVIERAAWLSWIASRREEMRSGALVVETYEVGDVLVRMSGRTAVVTGVVRSTWTRHGEPGTSNLRFTNVWLEEAGQWRRAAFHDSAIPSHD